MSDGREGGTVGVDGRYLDSWRECQEGGKVESTDHCFEGPLGGRVGREGWKDGLEGWVGRMGWKDGLEGRVGREGWKGGSVY